MIVSILQSLGATGLVTLSAIGIGGLILSRMQHGQRPVDRLCSAMLGGFAVLGLYLFLVGQWTLANLAWLPLLAVLAVLGCWHLWSLRATFAPPRSPLIWCSAGVMLLLALSGLSEPMGDIGNDTIAYHLLGPKVWVRSNAIVIIPESCRTSFPALIEVLFVPLLVLSGPNAVGLLCTVFAAILLVQAWLLCKDFNLSDSVAATCTLAVATMPAVMSHADDGFVDVAYAAYLVSAARWLRRRPVSSALVVSAFFTGACAGIKYTGLIAIGVLTGVVWFRGLRERSGAGAIAATRPAILFAIVSVAVASPWYVRNWIHLGSPIYPPPPVVAQLSAPRYMPAESVADFHEYVLARGVGMGRSIGALLLLPWNYTFYTNMFHGAGGVGLLMLGFVPLAIGRLRRHSGAAEVLTLGVLFVLTWFITQQEARFAIPMVIWFSAVGAIGLQYVLGQASTILRIAAIIAVALPMAYGASNLARQRIERVKTVFHPDALERARERRIPHRRAFAYLNAQTPGTHVLILEPSVPEYYLDHPFTKLEGGFGEQPAKPPAGQDELVDWARQRRITHILDTRLSDGNSRVSFPLPGTQLVYSDAQSQVLRLIP